MIGPDVDPKKLSSSQKMKLITDSDGLLIELLENTTINGDCCLAGLNVSYIPDGLRVRGTLDLLKLPITKLPDGLVVGKNLDVGGCTMLKELPENLVVGGYLSIIGSGIIDIPESAIIVGHTYRSDRGIAWQLPCVG